MPEADDLEIYVLTAPLGRFAPDGRPIQVREGGGPSLERVPMAAFRSGMTRFMDAVHSMVGEIKSKSGGFEVQEIEIAASIGADGKVAFLGSGVGVDSSASFKVKLIRPNEDLAGRPTAPGTVRVR